MPNIFEFPSSDQAPIMARSPFTNVNTGATNSVVYGIYHLMFDTVDNYSENT